MPTSKRHDSALFVPPEGVARITGEVTYDGRYYEDLGTEIIGAHSDPITGDIPGIEIQKYGKLLQVIDDGDPTTPVWYEAYDGDEDTYTPIRRTGDYDANVKKYIVDGKFAGHPTEPEE